MQYNITKEKNIDTLLHLKDIEIPIFGAGTTWTDLMMSDNA